MKMGKNFIYLMISTCLILGLGGCNIHAKGTVEQGPVAVETGSPDQSEKEQSPDQDTTQAIESPDQQPSEPEVASESTTQIEPEPEPTVDLSSLTTTTKYTTVGLHVRTAPSASSEIVTTLKPNAKVAVVSQADGWSKIVFNGAL